MNTKEEIKMEINQNIKEYNKFYKKLQSYYDENGDLIDESKQEEVYNIQESMNEIKTQIEELDKKLEEEQNNLESNNNDLDYTNDDLKNFEIEKKIEKAESKKVEAKEKFPKHLLKNIIITAGVLGGSLATALLFSPGFGMTMYWGTLIFSSYKNVWPFVKYGFHSGKSKILNYRLNKRNKKISDNLKENVKSNTKENKQDSDELENEIESSLNIDEPQIENTNEKIEQIKKEKENLENIKKQVQSQADKKSYNNLNEYGVIDGVYSLKKDQIIQDRVNVREICEFYGTQTTNPSLEKQKTYSKK